MAEYKTSKLTMSQAGYFQQAPLLNSNFRNKYFHSGGTIITPEISQKGTNSVQQIISISQTRVVLKSFRGLTLAGRLRSLGARPSQVYSFEIQNFAGGALPVGAPADYITSKQDFAGGAFPAGAQARNTNAKFSKWIVCISSYLYDISKNCQPYIIGSRM